ncbi:hypothetical protein A4X13_0g8951 [Tilletia indica]|uniref:Uncharacterized protein n=1 Tax=Tilletia indica TaxID=43049 RepID=A0A8T8SCA4_9BASI|nr:hypothetical protein A4X13_0g8951 [Tilletia indica]
MSSVDNEDAEGTFLLAVEDLPAGKSTIAMILMVRIMATFEAIVDVPVRLHFLFFGHVAVSYARAIVLGHDKPSPVPTFGFELILEGSRVASFSTACHPSYVRWGQAEVESLPDLFDWATFQGPRS